MTPIVSSTSDSSAKAGKPAGESRFYDAGLDLLRFLAFLMVFGFHAHKHVSRAANGFFKIGIFGVGVFFVLSAYLITELLLRESERTGTVSLRKFYVRRLLRIWPLYFLVLLVGILFGLASPHYHVSLGKALCFSFLLGNVYAARFGVGIAVIFPLWTLSIEEQFYAVIPALMKRGGRALLGLSSIFLLALAYATLFYLGRYSHVAQNEVVNFNSFVQFQFFAAGTLLAMLLHGRSWNPSRLLRLGLIVVSGVGLAVCIGFFLLESPRVLSSGVLMAGYLVRLLSTLGLFLGFLNINLIKLGRFGGLTYLGRISYGLYVYHAIVLTALFGKRDPLSGFLDSHFWIGNSIALLLTILIASISYRWFEQPILRLKSRFEIVKTGLPEPTVSG